jgi:hypothetical protein
LALPLQIWIGAMRKMRRHGGGGDAPLPRWNAGAGAGAGASWCGRQLVPAPAPAPLCTVHCALCHCACVMLPKFHCELNDIERVWAMAKLELGIVHCRTTLQMCQT